ncbi:MAG: hypothetical protein QM703_19050 [Gemmatales bacterium]
MLEVFVPLKLLFSNREYRSPRRVILRINIMQTVTRIVLIANLFLTVPAMAQPGKDGPGKKHEAPGKSNQGSQNHGKAANHPSLEKGTGKELTQGKLFDNDKGRRDGQQKSSPARSQSDKSTSTATNSSAEKTSKRTLTETQQQNVDTLTKDLQGLKAGSEVTPEMVSQLKTDMLAMCDNANKPSQESVQKLSKDLSSSLSDKTLSNQEKAQLA